jgi:transposase
LSSYKFKKIVTKHTPNSKIYFLCTIETMISIPLSEYNELKTLVVQLSEKVKRLEEEINLLRNGRNSKTSSTPPSHDIGRSNSKSLRTQSGRKSGGQPGHNGSTLKMKEVPDKIVDYMPGFCRSCGTDLQNEAATISDRKQEVVIPPIEVQYVEHRSHSKTCPDCGIVCTAALPGHLKAPIQYGRGVCALITYLTVYQYMPFKRLATLFRDVFKIPLSQGTIDNLLNRTALKAEGVYEAIKDKVAQSAVVGGDETGCPINGKKGWIFTWQNKAVTFIASSLNRGYETIEKFFPTGFPHAVYVSDCLPAQLKTPAKLHQLCLAHLQRELNNFENALYCTWSKKMKQLLLDAIALKKQFTEEDYNNPPPSVTLIQEELDGLLAVDSSAYHHKVKAFIKRLNKNRQAILTFLYYENVPADNNGSEQAVRNIKVKTKVSGQFKSDNGAHRFAILRSVIDTTIKNGQSVFQALTALEEIPT